MFAWYGRKQSYYKTETKKCDRQKLTVTLKVFFIKAFLQLWFGFSKARQACRKMVAFGASQRQAYSIYVVSQEAVWNMCSIQESETFLKRDENNE